MAGRRHARAGVSEAGVARRAPAPRTRGLEAVRTRRAPPRCAGAYRIGNSSLEHLTQDAGLIRGPTPVGKSYDFEDTNRTIERNRNHIAESHGVAGPADPPPIDANLATRGQGPPIPPRAPPPRRPKPVANR